MSSTIEERVVSMQFKGEQFLTGINKSLQSLENLNSKLKMTEGTKGLDGVAAAAERQHGALSKIAQGVDSISSRFSHMGVVGVTALSNITNQALFAGERLIKSLTVEPILDGFHEYETNLNSIQVILSNTAASGATLNDVTAALDELNHYSDQTIYNFSEMAKNIGTFTAAGVGLKPATQAIKGIANLAALSGSNSQQASTAMYQLSQAISAGRVSLEDWNSVVNAGMGGAVFQRALALTAQKVGTLSKGSVKLTGDMKNVSIAGKSFRESITAKPGETSWLTADVLTKTLSEFTGDLTDAELAVMGFNKTEIAAIQAQAAMAKSAATEVKTMSQLLGTLKESAGSGWAQTWKTIFGDFPAAKKLFTDLNNSIGGFISASADARNKVIQDWADLGGRTALIEGIGNAFKFLIAVIKPIRNAFREVFPPATGAQLAQISFIIRNFTRELSVSGSTANKIQRVFKGFFSIFGIGIDIIKPFLSMIGRLAGVAFEGSGGFLDFAAKVGDFIVNLRQALQEGKGIENFFRGLGSILEIPIRALKLFAMALKNAFDKIGADKVLDGVTKLSAKMGPMADQAEKVATGWEKVKATLLKVWSVISGLGAKFAGVGKWIAKLFDGMDFGDITKGLNTGLFAAIAIMFKQWLGGGKGGIMQNLSDSVEELTNTLKSMQLALKATALLEIALAIGVLAIALNQLAKIDAAGLGLGTAALATLTGELLGTMVVIEKFISFKGAAKLPLIAASMIILGVGLLILTQAVKQMASLDWETLSRGLTGITVLLAEMVAVAYLMPKGASFLATAVSMVILAASIKTLAGAVQILGSMSWEDMARGLTGIGVLLGGLLLFVNNTKMNAKGLVSGVVVYFMAKAIATLGESVKEMAKLSWEEMGKGLSVTTAGLALISAALRSIPKGALLSAVSIFIAAQSLKVINDALATDAGMSWESIGKGMTVMAGALIILAAALKVMQGSLLGAVALAIAASSLDSLSISLAKNAKLSWTEIAKGLTVIAGALLILSTAMLAMEATEGGAIALLAAAASLAVIGAVMVPLSKLSWEQVAIGMTVLAGVFIILGLAALILEPVIPALFALALSIALIGAAMLLAGAGIALFGAGILLVAAGFAALAVSGLAGAAALVGMIGILLGGLPVIMQFIDQLLVATLQLVIDVIPKITEAGVKIILALLDGMYQVMPKFIEVVLFLMLLLLEKLNQYEPKILDAGLRLLIALLKGWKSRIGAVADAATDLIVAFLGALNKNIPRIADKARLIATTLILEIGKNANALADAGMRMIISFINGLADSVRAHSGEMREAGKNLALAIIDGMTGGLASGLARVVGEARNIAQQALAAAKNALGIHSPSKEFEKVGNFVNDGFVKGLLGNREQIDGAFADLNDKITDAMQSTGEDIDALKEKLAKLTSARKKDKKAIADTRAELAQAQKLWWAEKNALDQVNVLLNDRHTRLGQLADQQDELTAKLDDANKTLEDAIKTRDDFDKQVSDQYDNLPDVSGEGSTLAGYVSDLRKQIEDTQTFAAAIQKLRDMGLTDELYKELLAKGPAALPFINDVLASGQDGVNELNKLANQLDDVAGDLGDNTSKELYQAGVNAAQGLVDGLKSQYDAISVEMNAIAASMVQAIKDALGIRSPSREFAKVGSFAAAGLTKGLKDATPQIEKVSTYMGKKAITSLRDSLSELPDTFSLTEFRPVIRPVLDLTDVNNGFSAIGKMAPGSRLSVGGTFSSASDASAGYNANRDYSGLEAATTRTELNYTQINNSPKALSSADIYRQTNNQLSVTKGVLARRANTSGS